MTDAQPVKQTSRKLTRLQPTPVVQEEPIKSAPTKELGTTPRGLKSTSSKKRSVLSSVEVKSVTDALTARQGPKVETALQPFELPQGHAIDSTSRQPLQEEINPTNSPSDGPAIAERVDLDVGRIHEKSSKSQGKQVTTYLIEPQGTSESVRLEVTDPEGRSRREEFLEAPEGHKLVHVLRHCNAWSKYSHSHCPG